MRVKTRKEWKPKVVDTSHIGHTSLMVDDLIIKKGTDVDKDVGTSSQQTDLENKVDYESNNEFRPIHYPEKSHEVVSKGKLIGVEEDDSDNTMCKVVMAK